MTKRKRQWYHRRTWKDAPSYLADEGFDKYGAWAEGYNAAIQTYVDELNLALADEQGLGDWKRP